MDTLLYYCVVVFCCGHRYIRTRNLTDCFPSCLYMFIVRLYLNKQIQQLEIHLHSVSVDEERKNSNFSASTTTPWAQFQTPPATAVGIDPMRFDAQVHLRNEPGNYEKWNTSSVSFSSIDRFGVTPYPLEREPYIPKLIEVNYIEGSSDKKWSGGNFPWTKKLEVLICIDVWKSIYIACTSDCYTHWSRFQVREYLTIMVVPFFLCLDMILYELKNSSLIKLEGYGCRGSWNCLLASVFILHLNLLLQFVIFQLQNSSSCYTTFLELTIFFFLYHISRSWLINNAMNWRFFLLLLYKWWSYTFEFRYISAACSYFSRDYPGNFSSCLTNSRSNNASIAGNIYYVIDSSLAFIVFVYLSFDNIRSSSLLG